MINFQDIAEIYLYREPLEGMAARLFAIRADENEVEYLKLVYNEMELQISTKSIQNPGCRKIRSFTTSFSRDAVTNGLPGLSKIFMMSVFFCGKNTSTPHYVTFLKRIELNSLLMYSWSTRKYSMRLLRAIPTRRNELFESRYEARIIECCCDTPQAGVPRRLSRDGVTTN